MDVAREASISSYDIVIVGAGLSGINTAYRIQTNFPSSQFVILESRTSIGGTWDLFRYPGIRSDSRLWTFGFRWRPWMEEKTLAHGSSILSYLNQSACEAGIQDKIKFNTKLLSANWSSDSQRWALKTQSGNVLHVHYAKFVVFCTGYYDYETPLVTTIPGLEKFTGTVVHPQFWPEDSEIDFVSKQVVVIGSGATAVTLVPELAKTAAHVTMLQRSPTYIASTPAVESFGTSLRKYPPRWVYYQIMRLRSLVLSTLFIKYCAFFPLRARTLLEEATRKRLPAHIPLDPHFRPSYNPWEQRLCVCPDGDFYKVLREGSASVVTDTITDVTGDQIKLTSGRSIKADVIITATGLKMQLFGGVPLSVDNRSVEINQKMLWRTAMIQDVPNAALCWGYPNNSWTLRADVMAKTVCRVLKHMNNENFTSATPRVPEGVKIERKSILQLSSTYVSKGEDSMPKAGNKAPWFPRSNYFWDFWDAALGNIHDCMEFRKVST